MDPGVVVGGEEQADPDGGEAGKRHFIAIGVQHHQQRLGLAFKTAGKQLLRADGRRDARRWQRDTGTGLEPA